MKKIKFLFYLITFSFCTQAQNVGIGTATPKSSAKLDVTATDRGILIPRLSTAQRLAIANPDKGLLVFDTDKTCFLYYNGYQWMAIGAVSEDNAPPQPVAFTSGDGSMDIDSSFAVIGSTTLVTYPNNRFVKGGITILKRTGNQWVKDTIISNIDTTGTNNFGCAVAVSKNYIIVGACTQKVNNITGQGRAYIYHYDGTRWSLFYTCTEGSTDANIYFGFSVDITEYNGLPVAVVGAPLGNKALRYAKTSAQFNFWSITYITPPLNVAGVSLDGLDQYGYSVSCAGNYAVVGAPNHLNPGVISNPSSVRSGAIYLFTGGIYTQIVNVQQTNSQNDVIHNYANLRPLRYGSSVSFDIVYARLLVGAPGYSVYTNSSAEAAVYESFMYNLQDTLRIAGYLQSYEQTNSQAYSKTNWFGASVSIRGEFAAVTEPGILYSLLCAPCSAESFASITSPGTAHIYHIYFNGSQQEIKSLQSVSSHSSDDFGSAAAVNAEGWFLINDPANLNAVLGQAIWH